MNIWWCEVHNACWVPPDADGGDPDDACLYWYWLTDTNQSVFGCRMVEMRLVPIDDKT